MRTLQSRSTNTSPKGRKSSWTAACRRVEAEQTARREFGNIGLIEQRSREVWQWPTAESFLADVRFALRQLVKSPGFTITAVATLALGIAVNATMFSLVSAFLLPHLPGRDPQSMVVVSSVNPDTSFRPDTNPVSPPNYSAWGKDTRVFSAVAAANEYLTGSLSGSAQQPEAITYAAVSTNYFSVFGVSPQLGRAFVAGEDEPGHDHILILSHGLWERRFGCGSFDRWTVGAPEPRGLRGGRCDAGGFPPAWIYASTLDAAHADCGGPGAQWPQESLSVHVCQARARHHAQAGACADQHSRATGSARFSRHREPLGRFCEDAAGFSHSQLWHSARPWR